MKTKAKVKKNITDKKKISVEEEIPTEIETPIPQSSEISEDLENKFSGFNNTVSDFTPDTPDIPQIDGGDNPSNSQTPQTPHIPTAEEQMKIKMFLGFCSFLLVGFNTWLLNYLRKTKVPTDKMQLSETELASFEPYFSGEEVLKILNKIPGWMIGIAHFEYMMFTKHRQFVDEYKITPKKKK